MEIVFLRHGMTPGNALKRYIGRTDEPLSDEGRSLALNVGSLPEVERVFVSPMRRAVETASILFPNAAQTVVKELREMDFGDFDGRSYREMEHDAAYLEWVDRGCIDPCPNGESMPSFQVRVCAAFGSVVHIAMAAGESTVYIVAHGGTIMAVMSKYVAGNSNYYDWYVENCSGWRFSIDELNWDEAPLITEYRRIERLG